MMRSLRNRLISTSFVVALLACGGCGSSNGLVPVEGVVTLDGQPLADATVVLHPDTAAGAGPFTATTSDDGKFVLAPAGNSGAPGAVPGSYRLTITTLRLAPSETGRDDEPQKVLAPELVPDEYRLGTMRFEVPEDGTTAANFDIRSR